MKIDESNSFKFPPGDDSSNPKGSNPKGKQSLSHPQPTPAGEYFRILLQRGDKIPNNLEGLTDLIMRASTESPETLIPFCVDPNIRGQVISGLYNAINIAPEYIPVLLIGLQDHYPVNLHAINALGRIGPPAKDAVPKLIELLKDENPDIRAEAVSTLGQIGVQNEEVVLAIVKLLEIEELPNIRERASFALAFINPEKGVPALLELLTTNTNMDSTTKSCIAYAFQHIGPAAKDAVPELINLLNDSRYSEVREAAAEALGEIGPSSKDAVPKLTELLEDRNEGVREAAAIALRKIKK